MASRNGGREGPQPQLETHITKHNINKRLKRFINVLQRTSNRDLMYEEGFYVHKFHAL